MGALLVGGSHAASLFSSSHVENIRAVRRAGLVFAASTGVACIVREILEKRRLWGVPASGVKRLSLARCFDCVCVYFAVSRSPFVLSSLLFFLSACVWVVAL